MIDAFSKFVASIPHWPIWCHFKDAFVSAPPPVGGNIFGFGEYVASFALLLVVFTISDFRYRYRFSLMRWDVKKLFVIVSFFVGFSILSIDTWYQNNLPVPKILANSNNLKVALGFIMLTFLASLIWRVVISPPKFGKWNAKRFYQINYHYIHEGNPERLQVVAEELGPSLSAIVKAASGAARTMMAPEQAPQKPTAPTHAGYAHNLLLLFADRRFCKIVVDRVPAFALHLLSNVMQYPDRKVPIFQFARNIGQEFIGNTNSAYYQEHGGYQSGLFGYQRPITHIVFGSYQFIEQCATDGESQLDTDYRVFDEYDGVRMEGFVRAALAFFEDYLVHTKGRPYAHSYALARLMSSFKQAVGGSYRLDGQESIYNSHEYRRLSETAYFITDAIRIADTHADVPRTIKYHDRNGKDIYDILAEMVFDLIFSASAVTSPPWTAWTIQHNTVWGHIFRSDESTSRKIIAYKIRRLIYNELRRMDQWPNFKGARIVGFCLLVLGLTLTNRRTGYGKEFYALQAAVLNWTVANYRRLLNDHPKVADACLMGSVTYDSDGHRLVKTFTNETQKEPVREFLPLA